MAASHTIHAIWLGSEPTEQTLASLRRLQALNPDREVRLWRDDDLDWLENRDLFEAAPTFQGKANLARYEILWRHGGYYVDCDFEWLRPLDEQQFPLDRIVVGIEGRNLYNNALIGAPVGHPFLRRLIERVRPSMMSRPDGRSFEVSGPQFITEQLLEYKAEGHTDVHLVARDLVYPYFWDKFDRARGPWPTSVVAVHHWGQGRAWLNARTARRMVLTANKRWEIQPRIRWVRRAVQRRDRHGALANFLNWRLIGSDIYVVTDASAALVEVAARSLNSRGRVFAYAPAELDLAPDLLAYWPPTTESAGTAEIAVEVVRDAPVLVGQRLDHLAHIRVLHLARPAACVEELRGSRSLIRSGRVDFVILTPEAEADLGQRRALARMLRDLTDAGARLGSLTSTGSVRWIMASYDPALKFTGREVVLDCRELRPDRQGVR